MRKQKHSPLPWSQSHRERKDGIYATEVYDNSGETIAVLSWYQVDMGNGNISTNREENAKFIVHACNNNARLKKENEMMNQHINYLIAQRRELANMIGEMKAENEQLNAERQTLVDECNERESDFNNSKDENNSLNKQINELIEERRGLADKVGETREENERLRAVLHTTLEALRDIVRQLPNNESLADFRLDFAEHAEAAAINALQSQEGDKETVIHINFITSGAKYLLWSFFRDEHGLILLDTDLVDIVEEVKKYLEATEEPQE